MPRTTVTIKNFKAFKDQQIKLITELSDRQLKECADNTTEVMQFHIQTSIERDGSTGKLASGIFTSKIPDGYGVGDIDNLNQNHKQWYWLNYGVAQSGRSIPPSTLEFPGLKGHFSSNDGGRFLKGQPNFPIFTTKPIAPHNYIEKTVQNIPTIVNSVLSKTKKLS